MHCLACAVQFVVKAIHKKCQYQRCWCLIFTSATFFATKIYMCDACHVCFPPFGVAYSIWGNLGCLFASLGCASSIRCPPPGSQVQSISAGQARTKSTEHMTRAGAHACNSWLMHLFLSFITLMAEKWHAFGEGLTQALPHNG